MDSTDRPSHFRVYLAVFMTSFLHVSTGAVMGWSSPILPKLDLSTDEESLVGSLYSLGAAPGPIIIAFSLDFFGRKGTIYVLWSFFLLSWIILLASKNIVAIYIARIIGGVGVGGACAALPVYITEIAIDEIRGRLGSMSYLLIVIGGLIVYAIGPFLDYYTLSIYGLSVAVTFAIFFYFVPESPYHYMRKGKRGEAKKALQRLRGYRTVAMLEKELEEIEKIIFQEKECAVGFREGIKEPVAMKAIAIGLYLMALQQFSAGNPLAAYSQPIFESAKLDFPASYVPVINSVCGLFVSFLPLLLLNRILSMKSSLLISGFGITLSLILLGLYFYLLNRGVNFHGYTFVPVIFLLLYTLFNGLGMGPVVWPMVAELLPLSVKGASTGICGCVSSLIGFGYLAIFPIIADAFGYSTVFFGFAAVLFVTTIGSTWIVPDTNGKSLQEIQDLLSK